MESHNVGFVLSQSNLVNQEVSKTTAQILGMKCAKQTDERMKRQTLFVRPY